MGSRRCHGPSLRTTISRCVQWIFLDVIQVKKKISGNSINNLAPYHYSDMDTEGVWRQFYTKQIVNTTLGMVGTKEVSYSYTYCSKFNKIKKLLLFPRIILNGTAVSCFGSCKGGGNTSAWCLKCSPARASTPARCISNSVVCAPSPTLTGSMCLETRGGLSKS